MDLLDLSAAFSSPPLPQGNRVAILTLGGDGGVASDLCTENSLVVQPLSERIIEKFNHWLPLFWSHANPADFK